jgi:hypothetical protein
MPDTAVSSLIASVTAYAEMPIDAVALILPASAAAMKYRI